MVRVFKILIGLVITYYLSSAIIYYLFSDPESRSSALKYALTHAQHHDQTALENIQAIAKIHKLKLPAVDKGSAASNFSKFTGSKDFCRNFSKNLSSMQGIQEVKPVAIANTYDDDVFDNLHGQCSNLELDTEVQYDPYYQENNTYIGTANFKAFIVDIDNDPSNGKEYLLYSERHYEAVNWISKMFIDWRGGVYQVARLDNCTPTGIGVKVSSGFSYRKPEKTGDYNAIISYQGKNYFLDVYYSPTADYQYYIWLKGLESLPICSFVIEHSEAVKAAKKERLQAFKKKRLEGSKKNIH